MPCREALHGAGPSAAGLRWRSSPVLQGTGELDASSSGPAGYEIAKLYANARNIVFRNGIHGQFPTELPSPEDRDYWVCALRLGREFFADPARTLDTGCADTRTLRFVR